MRKLTALLLFSSASALLVFSFPAAGFAPAPPPRTRAAPRLLAGKWTVKFANGVVQTSELGKDGSASVTEPARSSPGKAEEKNGRVVIRFNDDRVERWSVNGRQVLVEHWFPAAAYPEGASVVGVAQRLP